MKIFVLFKIFLIVFGVSISSFTLSAFAQETESEAAENSEGTDASDSKSTPSPTEDPVVEPTSTPTAEPTVSPTPVPAESPETKPTATPVATPKATGPVQKDYHAKTPPSVANLLAVGLDATVGLGTGDDYSSDRVGFGFFGDYTWKPIDLLADSKMFFQGRFLSTTGLDKKKDYSRAVQYYLAGFGIDTKFTETAKWRFKGSVHGGPIRSVAVDQSSDTRVDATYGFAAGVNAKAVYDFWQKLGGFAGVDVTAGTYGWYAFQFGALARF